MSSRHEKLEKREQMKWKTYDKEVVVLITYVCHRRRSHLANHGVESEAGHSRY